MAYALAHEEMRTRVREITARSFDAGADWLRAVGSDEELPMSPDLLVRVIHALIEGLTFQRVLTPELVPDAVFYEAFAAIAGAREPRPTDRPVIALRSE